MRTATGLFLITHGLVTALIWAAPRLNVAEGQVQPPDPSHSWLFGDVRIYAVIFGVVVGVAMVTAGAGFLTHQSWWVPVAVAAGSSSLVLFGVFFTPWWLAGIAISAALVIGALRADQIS